MKKLLFCLPLLLLVACSPRAKPIEYGADKCDFCRMTIVDPQFSAEAVSTKGRVYKFDAIECMIHYLQQEESTDFALFLVNDYHHPGDLIGAETCTFLITPGLPSPMGANLTAFGQEQEAKKYQMELGGELYQWEELLVRLKN